MRRSNICFQQSYSFLANKQVETALPESVKLPEGPSLGVSSDADGDSTLAQAHKRAETGQHFKAQQYVVKVAETAKHTSDPSGLA